MMIKTPSSTPGGPKSQEEKMFVTVRVRPLSQKQHDLKDQLAVECTDDHTIQFKNASIRRSNTSSYTFDKVFGPSCLTEKVYKEGAKDVALSSLSGINATIFAYGQTGSGKTFTMRGITERVIKDIYNHIHNTPNRIFVIKLSALEIYNETVVDMLNPESGQLRLLDDPEKGTIVEKLDEKLVEDDQHLTHLINICEARRQVGETSLNDSSSRSHQIIRLMVESSLAESTGCVKSFLATLNLVDLAGSERASQSTISARLKEGRHINLSLLTLSTVIRKLSGGQRNCHIPYRDSKLTRILQPSLGGNARTAIICTLSPALSHLEQSQKTLKFAINAKEVTNVAQVNMVVSDKQLVKNLQKEVARLVSELRTPDPSSSSYSENLMREKEIKIQQLEMELKALKLERDIARFELAELRREVQSHEKQGSSHRVAKCLTYAGSERKRITVGRMRILRQPAIAPSTLMHEIQKLEQIEIQLGLEAKRISLLLHNAETKEDQDAAKTLEKLLAEIKEMRAASTSIEEVKDKDHVFMKHNAGTNLKEEIIRLNTQGSSSDTLEMQLQNAHKSIDRLMMSLPNIQATPVPRKSQSRKSRRPKRLPLVLSNIINSEQTIRSPCTSISSAHSVRLENVDPVGDELVPRDPVEHCTATPEKGEYGEAISPMDGTPGYQRSSSVDVRKMEKIFKNAVEENVKSIKAYVTELKERVAKLQYQKRLLVSQVLELEETNEVSASHTELTCESPPAWDLVFEDQRKQIILLWHLCHVSIIRRSQFYLLFRGDPADQMYMEVELQRLMWLEEHLADLGNGSPALLGDEPAFSISSSIKALKHEREILAKKVNSRLSSEEREVLYAKWDVPVSGKQRRLQLVNKLWTDPHDMEHVQESAVIVAKLAGFYESGGLVAKEMLELNFVSPQGRKLWHLDWSPISNLLRL